MKKLWGLVLVMAMLAVCLPAAYAADGATVSVRSDATATGWIELSELEESGLYTLMVSNTLDFSLTNVGRGNICQVRLSGIAEDGNPFEVIASANDDAHLSLSGLASKAGTYGPHTLEITGGGMTVRYPVMLNVRAGMGEGPGVMEEGRIAPSEFIQITGVMAESETADGGSGQAAFSFLNSPNSLETFFDGAIFYGQKGYTLPVGLQYNHFIGKIDVTLTDLTTNKLVGSVSADYRQYEQNYMSTEKLVVKNDFTSGGEFELAATDGTYTQRMRIVLVDETKCDVEVSDKDKASVKITDAGERVDFETYPADERPVIDVGGTETWSDGRISIWCTVPAGNVGRPYRVRLIGKTRSGQPFEMEYAFNTEMQTFNADYSAHIGTYGPFEVEMYLYGQLLQRYEFDISVPHERGEQYGFGDQGRFVSERKFVEDRSAQSVALLVPAEGSQVSGRPGDTLPIKVRKNTPNSDLFYELVDPQTGRVLSSAVSHSAGLNAEGSLVVEEDFESGTEVELRITENDTTWAYRFTLVKPGESGARVVLAGSEDFTLYGEAVPALLEARLSGLDAVETDIFHDFERHSFAPGSAADALFTDFAVWQPNVFQKEVQMNRRDLISAANWAFYDEYRFQMEDLGRYTDARPVNTETLGTLFGAQWRELAGFDFATGLHRTDDGDLYYWAPVYYPGADGGIEGGQVYLYAYIARLGAARDYLTERADCFIFGDYRTDKLLISDQDAVAEILRAMRAEFDFLEITENNGRYDTLAQNNTGSAVRALQTALFKRGYLSGFVDGVYGQPTVKAVTQFQKDMGLKATGKADEETQRLLLSDAADKQLLLDWLNAR